MPGAENDDGTSMVRVLIADDQVLIRAGIAAILRAAPGYEVVGEACDGEQAVKMAELTEPDVVLMDIRMPEVDGIAATRRILGSGRPNPPRILILTTFDIDEYVYKALRAGASGFVLKDTPPERLLAALKAVGDGDTLFSPTVTARLVQAFCAAADGVGAALAGGGGAGAASGAGTGNGGAGSVGSRPTLAPAERAALATLTARETDVLRLVATGLSNAEIAERLVVSEGTVKTHLNRSMAKLNLSSRAQVVVLAYESGLVIPGQPKPQSTPGPPHPKSAPTPGASSPPAAVPPPRLPTPALRSR
ncbi:response regulator transcription factor [Actinospica sp.]|jgi:DNA-binding NarL/FixJ family response regulator|uniref:response regulator transcription factor n=1 Tax=Actinospica sp. TaxID=1872142 RepID=UPI002CFA5230|nr:response regulator transcription factor [Actinospica sp.]HWG24173.1 response regulator transcription factor [Actinospica sp.]